VQATEWQIERESQAKTGGAGDRPAQSTRRNNTPEPGTLPCNAAHTQQQPDRSILRDKMEL